MATLESILKGITQYYAFVREKQTNILLNQTFFKITIAKLGYSCFYVRAKVRKEHRIHISMISVMVPAILLSSFELFSRDINLLGINIAFYLITDEDAVQVKTSLCRLRAGFD